MGRLADKLTHPWFGSTTPLVLKGRRKKLYEESLRLPKGEAAGPSYLRFKHYWDEECQHKAKPSLFRALVHCYWRPFLLAGIFKLLWGLLVVMCAGFFVYFLVDFVADGEDREEWHGWVLAGFFFLDCFLLSVCMQQMGYVSLKLGIRLRGALMTAVYNKALKLESSNLEVGEIINLAANDCSRLFQACTSAHNLWSSIFESLLFIGVVIYLIGYKAGLVGFALMLLAVPLQFYLGFLITRVRSKAISCTDERVRLMHEILVSIKLIKFYAWEKSFLDSVGEVRKKELMHLRNGGQLKSVNLMMVFVLPPLIALTMFAVYVVALDNTMEGQARMTFTVISLLNSLRFPLVVLPKAFRVMAESLAAAGRLQSFLLRKETAGRDAYGTLAPITPRSPRGSDATFSASTNAPKRSKNVGVFLKNATFEVNGKTILKNISLTVKKRMHVAVVGSVGSGKTSLLSAVLGELKLKQGKVKVGGEIAYVSQEAWIQQTTVRENILFGQPYDEERYNKTVFCCCLNKDFEQFPEGDASVIGEGGGNLSGGQKQRIALARAVYSKADMFLLDSPLSAVDANTSSHIFRHCLKGLLADRTILIITHHLHLLHEFDAIVILKGGSIAYSGPPDSHALATHLPAWGNVNEDWEAKTLESVKEVEKELKTRETKRTQEKGLEYIYTMSLEESLLSSDSSSEDEGDQLDQLEEAEEVENAESYELTEEPEEKNDDLAPTKPEEAKKPEQQLTRRARRREKRKMKKDLKQQNKQPKMKSPKHKSYAAYISQAGVASFLWAMFLVIFTQIIRIVSDYWLAFWNNDTFGYEKWVYCVIYAGFVTAFGVSLYLRGTFFYLAALRAARKLQSKMFYRMLHAPLSFFTFTPLGVLLNCSSKDQDKADEQFPDSLHLASVYFLVIITTDILVSIVLPYYSICVVFLLVTLFLVQWFSLRSANYLRNLSASTNSHIFAHISETFHGLHIVRAFKAEERFKALNEEYIDKNHRSLYNLELLGLWQAFRLDTVASILVCVTALMVVGLADDLKPGEAGLAISNSIQKLIFLTMAAKEIAEFDFMVDSVGRITEVTKRTPMERFAGEEPPSPFPSEGGLKFLDAKMRYSEESELVLKGITLDIIPNTKVGIVGRTGSGKSSTVLCLFRMAELCGGKIEIDGVDISTLALQSLRHSIAIIPQESAIFKGTIRSNLDPFSEHDDEELWSALEKSHLADFVKDHPLGLSMPISSVSDSLSLGQRQLVCIARAILTNSKVPLSNLLSLHRTFFFGKICSLDSYVDPQQR
ncbi:Canalicular multispecific organic anion transporter 1, variant 2 [Balamuthia mandrillaris]